MTHPAHIAHPCAHQNAASPRAAAGGVLLPAPGTYYQPVHKG